MTAQPIAPELRLLVQAALPHVAFDGWTEAALSAAAAEIGMDRAQVNTLVPRGAVDLAAAAHRIGDADMRDRLAGMDLSDLRFRDRVATALRERIAVIADREATRRATAVFALPHHAAQGAALIWGTADAIWDALGDHSSDAAWYTKRATLSAVWTSVVLYWLGDETPGATATGEFIDRRVADVMRFEKAKAKVNASTLLKPLTGLVSRAMAGVKAPTAGRDDLPGRWAPKSPGEAQ